MPLLNKKPLELHRYNKKLKDDAEVFYCECTNEIFEDYEEYCQRIIACNSLIWTCAITGKHNLTYQEAVASEQNALKTIKDFPLELRTPILYLATRGYRKNFNELVNDVFVFAKDRYFLGESVEVNFDGFWVYGHILQVFGPTPEEVEDYKKENNISKSVNNRPYPSSLYKYEVEQLDDDSEVSEIRILPASKVRRIKCVFTREKCRIYLRQFVEYKNDRWQVQSNILAKYSISSLIFSHLFVGEPPTFNDPPMPVSRYSQPTLDTFLSKNGDKKSRKSFDIKDIRKKYEDTIDSVVQQSRKGTNKKKDADIFNKKDVDSGKKKEMDESKKRELEEKAKQMEELRKKKEQEKEEKLKLQNFVKEWYQKREDLECEDLKVLPEPCPVDCRIPNEYFGDLVMILEFFTNFKEVLKVKDYFPFGLKFDLVERALVEVEIAGPFSDILQLLLTSLFTLQEQEDDEIQSTNINFSTDLDIDKCGDMSTEQSVKLATIAASWSQAHHGVNLNELSLDAITVTEVLRLHLLSSGGRAGERSAKWRYQERGGYTSADDPCLVLRLQEPHILRFLAVKSVAELPIADKIKILTCLMNQILTYAELRDLIDDQYDKVKTIKVELKNDQIAESRKERELTAQKLKEKKEAKEKGETIPEETEEQKLKEEKELNRKKAEFQRRTIEFQKAALACHVTPLGQDRGYRRYWIFNTMGGLFVEDNELFPGSCLPEPTPTARGLGITEEDTMSYIKRLFEEERNCGSDKENEGNSSHPVGSPKKKLLSESNDLSNSMNSVSYPVKTEDREEKTNNLICTANKDTCPVHSCRPNRLQWAFFYKEQDIEDLINSLNKRGYRELGLRKNLIEYKDNIIPKLSQCPVQQLNRFSMTITAPETAGTTKFTRSQKGYENANLKYPAGTPIQEILELYIRELILDTEEKIYCGGLGVLKVKNRKIWREAIEARGYDKQDDNLVWRQYPIKKEVKEEKKEDDNSRPDTPCSLDSNPEQDMITVKSDQSQVVKDLASAVLQIARSVEQKYLQKPLWDEKKKEKVSAMERWESSLMSSTSFAQVYLHIATLENSIQWNKSALNARCKVCRRGGDGENMLLCDNCDRGFHLYCLKPKLTAIPKGDWFCPACRPKEKVEKTRKSRKLFSEESDEEEEEQVSSSKSRRSKEEAPKKRKYKRVDDDDDDEDDDSGDEPLAKIARTVKKSAQR